MSITFTQLTAFLAVIEGGSVTAAADELVVTQPSVSAAIGALGKDLGCELFERSGRGIRLTEAGTAFSAYAEDIVGLLDAGRQAAREAAARSAGRLRIAAVPTAAESFVPLLMRAFADAHPALELTLDVGNDEDVAGRVLTHRDDVAFAARPSVSARLATEPFLANEIVCITAPDDPSAGGGPLPAAALADRPWLLREPGSGTRAINERFLADRAISPRTLTLGSNGAIAQAARARLGVSLVSRAAVATQLGLGRLGEIRLIDGPETRSWFVLRSTVGPTRPAVERFVQFVRDQGAAVAARDA